MISQSPCIVDLHKWEMVACYCIGSLNSQFKSLVLTLQLRKVWCSRTTTEYWQAGPNASRSWNRHFTALTAVNWTTIHDKMEKPQVIHCLLLRKTIWQKTDASCQIKQHPITLKLSDCINMLESTQS